jgi:hypothetical protein
MQKLQRRERAAPATDAVKIPINEQEHLAQRRRGAEVKKKTEQLFISKKDLVSREGIEPPTY